MTRRSRSPTRRPRPPGYLTNGDYTLPSRLQVKATSATGSGGGTFANVGTSASPTPLLSYPRALNDAAITLDFKQHVSATDALRAGRYSKTLTFTLATTDAVEPAMSSRGGRAAAPARSHVTRISMEGHVVLELRRRFPCWD